MRFIRISGMVEKISADISATGVFAFFLFVYPVSCIKMLSDVMSYES